MIYQLYKKQVEAWKEELSHTDTCSAFCDGECNQAHTHFDEQDCNCIKSKLLLSRHKDTIELIEAIIKEVEGMRKENSAPKWDAPKNQRVIYAHSRRDGYNTALKDLLTKLQASLTLLKNER